MKIMISPSKTQESRLNLDKKLSTPKFTEKTMELVEKIKTFSKEDLAKIMAIEGDILENTYSAYLNFHQTPPKACISRYHGLVFKGLDLLNYSEENWNYLQNSLVILSALYGCLKPFDGIKPYRLDMKMKVMEGGLYHFWQNELSTEFLKEDIVINLASSEFSKLIRRNFIDIEFLECSRDEKTKKEKYKNLGTYTKQARGFILDYMVKEKITNVEKIKNFNKAGYSLNEGLSTDTKLVFTRKSPTQELTKRVFVSKKYLHNDICAL